jgi:hypothetical protein
MNTRCTNFHRGASRNGGTVLVVCLLLLAVLTVLAVSSTAIATLDLRMAGNEQSDERALQAADSAIERAIAAGEFDVATTVGTYVASLDPTAQPTPVRGTGRQGCLQSLAADGSPPTDTGDCYEYFVRFDAVAGETPVPGDTTGLPVVARHFVIDAFGTSARGAEVELQASVYVTGPPPSVPVRTSWRQRGNR